MTKNHTKTIIATGQNKTTKFINKFKFIIFCFAVSLAHAETSSQTLCFSSQKNKRIELVLRKYLDTDIQQEVGALVKYSTSKKTIPLVYIDDSTTDDSMDYEIHWLEVFNGKVTGEYGLLKPKNSTILGVYVTYKSLQTGKEVIFSPSGKYDDDCAAMLKQ